MRNLLNMYSNDPFAGDLKTSRDILKLVKMILPEAIGTNTYLTGSFLAEAIKTRRGMKPEKANDIDFFTFDMWFYDKIRAREFYETEKSIHFEIPISQLQSIETTYHQTNGYLSPSTIKEDSEMVHELIDIIASEEKIISVNIISPRYLISKSIYTPFDIIDNFDFSYVRSFINLSQTNNFPQFQFSPIINTLTDAYNQKIINGQPKIDIVDIANKSLGALYKTRLFSRPVEYLKRYKKYYDRYLNSYLQINKRLQLSSFVEQVPIRNYLMLVRECYIGYIRRTQQIKPEVPRSILNRHEVEHHASSLHPAVSTEDIPQY